MIIVDRIENGFAICEIEDTTKDIPLDRIIGEVLEGDVLNENESGTHYVVDREATEQRQAAIKERFERLKARNSK
jgi:hypothetical protein